MFLKSFVLKSFSRQPLAQMELQEPEQVPRPGRSVLDAIVLLHSREEGTCVL